MRETAEGLPQKSATPGGGESSVWGPHGTARFGLWLSGTTDCSVPWKRLFEGFGVPGPHGARDDRFLLSDIPGHGMLQKS